MILTDILDAAGVEIKYRAGSTELNICCPFCPENGESADTRFRLGINTASGAASCFNCKWKARGVMYTARQLCRIFGIKFNLRSLAAKQDETKKKEPKKGVSPVAGLPAEYEDFAHEPDAIGFKARKYLRLRGVSTLQIVKHRIGFAAAGDMAWRVLFPVVDSEGVTHGCVGRDFSGNQSPKYLNTPGMKLLWNAHRVARTAVVVEGVMDALRVEHALLQMHDSIPVARLGSTITSAQLDQLKLYERVVVLPDWDRAGVVGAIELCNRCTARGMVVLASVPDAMSGIDPGDMTENTIVELIKDAVPWTTHVERHMRLAATREESDE